MSWFIPMEFNSELKIAIVGWLEKVMTMENKLPTSLSLSEDLYYHGQWFNWYCYKFEGLGIPLSL